jgi:hypothetical protein
MAAKTVEERLTELEAKVDQILTAKPSLNGQSEPWWRKIEGRFKDNPEFDEAMRLGREYRETLGS